MRVFVSVLMFVLVSSISVVAGEAAKSYKEAYNKAVAEKRPLVVLVGATWCPSCIKMHDESWHEIVKEEGAVYVAIDYDADNEVATKILSGNSIPQIVVYKPNKDNWICDRRIGFCQPGPIRTWLRSLFGR